MIRDFEFQKRLLKYSLENLAEIVDDSIINLSSCKEDDFLSCDLVNNLFARLFRVNDSLSDCIVGSMECKHGKK